MAHEEIYVSIFALRMIGLLMIFENLYSQQKIGLESSQKEAMADPHFCNIIFAKNNTAIA